MALDLATISPEARRRYIRLGRRYQSPDVLAQAAQIVLALPEYGAVIARHGFGVEEQEQVVDAHGVLLEQQDSSNQAVAQHSITGQTYEDAIEKGKAVRQTTRTTCKSIDKAATEKDDLEVSRVVRTALTQTSRLRRNKFLVDHLSILYTAIATPIVLPYVESRGGADLIGSLQSTRAVLRTAQNARAGHTPVTVASETCDLLDGLIVSLARSARDAAEAAARHLGQPSIAAAFKLNHLRRRSASSRSPQGPDGPPDIDDIDDEDGDIDAGDGADTAIAAPDTTSGQ
jgi:hypothetical protein